FLHQTRHRRPALHVLRRGFVPQFDAPIFIRKPGSAGVLHYLLHFVAHLFFEFSAQIFWIEFSGVTGVADGRRNAAHKIAAPVLHPRRLLGCFYVASVGWKTLPDRSAERLLILDFLLN